MELDDITTDEHGKVLTVTVDADDYDRLLKDAMTLRSRIAELEDSHARQAQPEQSMNAPQYMTDNQGNRTGVVLDLATYQQMLAALKDAEASRSSQRDQQAL